MATFTTTFMTAGVGAVWVQALQHWSDYWRSASGSLTYTLTTANGYRALLINRVDPTNTYNYTFCASDIASAATCSLRHIAQSPGWRAKPNYEEAIAGSGLSMVNAWRAKVVALRRSIWSTWAGASLGTQQSETVLAESSQYNMFTDYWRVSRAYELMADAMLIYGWLSGTAIAFEASKGPCDGLDTYPSPVSMDLTGVTQALTDIAQTRTDISLNHGNYVFSVLGGTLVG